MFNARTVRRSKGLVALGVGVWSFIAAQPEELTFQPGDRRAVLTINDLGSFLKNGIPERGTDKSSKNYVPGRGHHLTYESTDPDHKVTVLCWLHVALTTDGAQTAYWTIAPDANPRVPAAVRRFQKSWVKDESLVHWGDEGSAYLIQEGSSILGGAFVGYRERNAVLICFVCLEPFGDSKPIGAILTSVLNRIETYRP
jgi:hypothetical protein